MQSRSTSRTITGTSKGSSRSRSASPPLVLPELSGGTKALLRLLLALQSAGEPPVCISRGLGEKAIDKLTSLLESKTMYRLQRVNRSCRLRSRRVYVTTAPGSLQLDGDSCIRSAAPDTGVPKSREHSSEEWKFIYDILNSLDHIAVQGYGADGTVRYWNRASEDLYGYAAKEALGKNLLDLIIPSAMRTQVRRAVRNFVKRDIPIPAAELQLQHRDGSPVPVFSQHCLLRLPDGEPLMLCLDISQSEQVRQRDTLTRTLFLLNESVKEQTCLYRLSQLQVTHNDPGQLLQSAATLIPAGWQFPDDTVCRIRLGNRQFISRPFQRPGPGMTETRLTSDGQTLEVSVYLLRRRMPADREPFLPSEFPLLQAVTDLLTLRLNQLIQERNMQDYQVLLERSQQIARLGSWRYLADTRELISTAELYRLFEIDRERFDPVRDSFLQFVDQPAQGELRKRMKQALKTGEPFSLIYAITTPRGNRKIIQDHVYPEKDAAGRVVRLYGTAQDITEIHTKEQQLKYSEEKYRRLFNASPLPKYILSISTRVIRDANESMLKHFGYTREELIGMSADKLRPPEEVPRFIQAMRTWKDPERPRFTGNFVYCHKDGSFMDIEIHAQRILFEGEECVMVIAHDITRRRRMESIEQLERRVLERATDPAITLSDLFDEYLREISRIFPGLIASILRVSKGRVFNLSSPNLPAAFQTAIEGLEIGPLHGSCGTAAFTGQRVIVSDIATHPYWTPYRDLALPLGLRACWSQPIFNTEGTVIATFALYYSVIKKPDEEELNFFSKSAYLVSLILSGFEKSGALAISNERYEYVIQATSEAIWDLDLQTGDVHWGEGFNRLFGFPAGKRIDNHEEFLRLVHPADLEKINGLFERVLQGTETVISEEYRIRRANGQYAIVSDRALIVRDPGGKPRRVIGSVQDITEQKTRQQQLELMEQIIVSASDAVVVTEVTDTPGQEPLISYVNAAFLAMTGYTEAELLGQSPRLLQGPDTDSTELRTLWESVAAGNPCEVTVLNYRKNGETFWNNIRVFPVANATGVITNWIAIERDVSSHQARLQHRELVEKIRHLFSQESELSSILPQVVPEIARACGYDIGAVWVMSNDQSFLHLAAFHDPDRNIPAEISDQLFRHHYEKGEGVPGQVWATGERVQITDIGTVWPSRLKSRDSSWKLGKVMGIPLLHAKKLVGVLVLGSADRENHTATAGLAGIPDDLELLLGGEIIRKKLEYELNLIFNTVPDLITVTGFDGYLKKINPAFSQLLGYTPEELLARPIVEFVHPDERARFLQDLQDLQERDLEFYYEMRGLTRDGKTVWLAWSAVSLHRDGLIFAVAKDITRQKELQAQLEHTYALAKIGTWEEDINTGVRSISAITRKILEVGDDYDPSSADPVNFYREDMRAVVRTHIENAMKEGTSFDFESPIITPNGNEKWVRSMGEAEMVNGQCIRIFGNIQDITKIKTAQLRLKKSHDNIPGILWQYALKPDGTDEIRHISQGIRSILGLEPSELITDTRLIWELMVEDDRAGLQQSLAESARTLTRWNHQWRMRDTNGELHYMEGFGTPTRLSNGSVLWDTAIFDITESRRTQTLVQNAVSLARIGTWQLDLRNNQLIISEALMAIMEWTTAPEKLEDALDIIDPVFVEEVSRLIDRARDEGKEYDIEIRMKTGKGLYKWVRIIGNPEHAEGRSTRLVGSCQDIHARKTVALQLEESYRAVARFKKALDQSTNLVITDPHGYIVEVNDRTCELTGYSREELIGQHTRINRSGHHDDAFFSSMWETISGGHIWRGEIQNRRKDGSFYWVDTIIVPILDDTNTIVQYMALRIDITARKEAELALNRAYQERNSILESIGDAFFAVDHDLRVTYWNKEAESIIGVRRDEITGRVFSDVFPAAFERIYTRRYQDELLHGRSCTSEEFLPALDKWIDISAYPSETGISVFFKDVTSRKQAVELLRISNERFEKITEATNDAIWDWDIEKNTIYRGGGFRTLFGYESGTVNPDSAGWQEHVHPDDQERLAAVIRAAIDNDSAHNWQAEYRFRRSDGQYVFVADRGLVIRNDQGQAVRMVGAIMDITFRREYEQSLKQLNESLEKQARELVESNAQLEQFAYVASHDLQEPLRMVTSFMAQLEKRYSDKLDEKARQYIGFATDGAARMRSMILALLEYSRVGRLHKQAESVDLNSVVDEVRLLHSKLIDEKGARIECSPLPVIRSNRISLLQLFNNLVSNALKFSADERPPLIRIQAVETETHWRFSVEDNGIGIEPEYFDRIFVIFQRLHNREQYEGTGMGLAIVKKIVETLGGRIWLESNPGVGTTFFFTLAKPVPVSRNLNP